MAVFVVTGCHHSVSFGGLIPEVAGPSELRHLALDSPEALMLAGKRHLISME